MVDDQALESDPDISILVVSFNKADCAYSPFIVHLIAIIIIWALFLVSPCVRYLAFIPHLLCLCRS